MKAKVPWLLALLIPMHAAAAEELLVFAAASTADALSEIGAAFEAETGVRVRISAGASSDLARQIIAGAPADLFLSADLAQMDRLIQAKLVSAEGVRKLLSNQLVIVARSGEAAPLRSLDELVGKSLALADPEAVPAGVYARTWLESKGRWNVLRDRVVPTLDVRAALAAVATGGARFGIVYATDAAGSKKVEVVYRVPITDGPPITYPVAKLLSSKKEMATRFLQSLSAPRAEKIFVRDGFRFLPTAPQ
ncbi:MAG TPA: molybdate ABC transporter substrate-binding protein [Myxococcaceae bacterium]|nr:molybdate ABC transporter substrate-binding protein [Myxococcaceae bacterium]